jgi:hypothetical protein
VLSAKRRIRNYRVELGHGLTAGHGYDCAVVLRVEVHWFT